MAMKPRVNVTIDRVTLHGFDPRDRRAIGDALGAELELLLGSEHAPNRPQRLECADAGPFNVTPATPARTVGRRIAASVGRWMRTLC
jgi:hypothetical protein